MWYCRRGLLRLPPFFGGEAQETAAQSFGEPAGGALRWGEQRKANVCSSGSAQKRGARRRGTSKRSEARSAGVNRLWHHIASAQPLQAQLSQAQTIPGKKLPVGRQNGAAPSRTAFVRQQAPAAVQKAWKNKQCCATIKQNSGPAPRTLPRG